MSKFIQIAVASYLDEDALFSIDDDGYVWRYNWNHDGTPDGKWVSLSAKREYEEM